MMGSRTLCGLGLVLLLGAGGCKKTAPEDVGAIAQDDPASVNMAPVNGQSAPPQRVLGDRETADQYAQGESPNEEYADQAPPPLPDYAQPVATRPNTIWTPGYWQYSPRGYYWVPGAWVAPPYTGALWTPGYWAADGPRYRFHRGYWGRHVGFYGGVPYGGGYVGTGYRGGYWRGNQFFLNIAVNHVDPNVIHDVYTRPEPSYSGVRVSYNGGMGGIALLPIAAELFAMHEQHERPLRYQIDVEREAGLRRGQFYGENHGRPEVYIAPAGFEVGYGRPQIVVQPAPVIEVRQGPPGHAYGLYKDHQDNGNHNGEFKEHGNPHGDHGNGDGNGNGNGHGKGNGKGHGHDK